MHAPRRAATLQGLVYVAFIIDTFARRLYRRLAGVALGSRRLRA
jgi:hypothetical protein